MSHQVIFSPESQDQLVKLFDYVAQAASPDTAARYTQAIVSYCESLCTFPLRGTRRDDVRPSVRIINYRKRAVIAIMSEPRPANGRLTTRIHARNRLRLPWTLPWRRPP